MNKLKIGDEFNPHKMFKGIFISEDLCKYKKINSTQKLIWGRLARYAGKDGKCFPSQKMLAEDIGVSEDSILRGVKVLEMEGFIKIERPTGKKRVMHFNCNYRFLWHSCFEESPPTDKPKKDKDSRTLKMRGLPNPENAGSRSPENAGSYKESNNKENNIKEYIPETKKTVSVIEKKESKKKTTKRKKSIPRNIKIFAKEVLLIQQKKFPDDIKDKDIQKRINGSADTLYKLQRIDGFNFKKQIKPIIEWAINDQDFWEDEIKSLAPIRKKSSRNGEMKFTNMKTAYQKSLKNNPNSVRNINKSKEKQSGSINDINNLGKQKDQLWVL